MHRLPLALDTMIAIAHQVIMLLGFVLVLTLVYICGAVIACLACRLKVDGVSVFYGKAVMTIETPLCPVAVGYLPCGGSVSFDIEDYDKRPFHVRCMVILSGVFAMLLVAGVCLRIDVAMSQFGSGFNQIVLGAVAPFEHGTPMVRAFFERANDSLILGCGLFAAKFAVLNMFLTGVRLLTEIPRNRQKDGIRMWCNVIVSLLGISILLCWLAALVNYFWHL